MLSRVAQPVKRDSMTAKMAYMPMAMMAMTMSPANARGVLKSALATSIRFPMPLPPATVSAITAPTNARVMAVVERLRSFLPVPQPLEPVSGQMVVEVVPDGMKPAEAVAPVQVVRFI